MSSIINKVKDALHHDSSSTTNSGTTSTGTTTGNNTTGTHATHGTAEGVAGPHSSRAANAADPRVDSDRDGRAAHNHGVTGQTMTGTTGAPEGVAGPHSSRIANAADPRVDSDRDGRAAHQGTVGSNTGMTGTIHHHGAVGSNTGMTGTSGMGSSTATGAGYGSSTTGPQHSSGMANKLDPRVDTTSYGAGQTGTGVGNHGVGGTGVGSTTGTGYGSTGTGDRGGLSSSTNAGPHNSNLANKADPRVDSDLDSTGNRHGASTHGGILGSSGTHATSGSGTAQNTQGPHNSDTLNKMDPRVDADGDGSKTYMGNKTHA